MNRFSYFTGLAIGILTMTIASCTTTDVLSDITSSTTPGSTFTRDGLVRDDQKVHVFARVNFENLKNEMALGQGEYLASFSKLLNISPNNRDEFFLLAKEMYPIIFASDRTTPEEMLNTLTLVLQGNSNSPILITQIN